ncbi:MAG: metal ABC transporter substrate-binding protein [Thermodesulfovibrionales bacterium]
MQKITPPFLLQACTSLLFIIVSLFLNVVEASTDKVKVVATITPLADFARQVGGSRVDVTLLLPAGASPHTYEATPKTVLEISKARVFIKIGAGLEFWADKLVSAASRDVITVTCSDGIALIKGGVRDYDHDHGHAASNVDPHIWLDPIICIRIINKIEDAFSRADPSNSSYYKKNASEYIARLTSLDREISEKVRTFRTKEYITFHSAWNYFSKRYGLRVAGVIEEGPGKEPSARHIGEILRLIKGLKTRVVFAEPQSSTRIAEVIAKEAGAQVLILDDLGGQKGRETYLDLMRYNLAVMEKAFK